MGQARRDLDRDEAVPAAALVVYGAQYLERPLHVGYDEIPVGVLDAVAPGEGAENSSS